MNQFSDLKNPVDSSNWIDNTGKILSHGDLLVQFTGSGPGYKSGKLWLFLGQQDSRGYYFDPSGTLTHHFHCSAQSSYILNVSKLTTDVQEKFKRGLYHFHVADGDTRDIHEILNDSDSLF